MSPSSSALLRNPQAIPEQEIPVVSIAEFRTGILSAVAAGGRLVALFGHPMGESGVKLCAILADDEAGEFAVVATAVKDRYPALTPDCPQAQEFERELAEQCGLTPEGHPWLKPVRNGSYPFFRVEGEEVHEVAVGPVHAGIIEPGHFRFQCFGERVLHLEIQLGYQHRGVERLLEGAISPRSAAVAESIAGDTVIGHALAFCEAIEALGECQVSPRAQALRGIALELERVANHVGDLGALGSDIGFLPAAAYFGRLRGEFLNLLMELTGSRYGRSFLRPGGVLFDLTPSLETQFTSRLEQAQRDLKTFAALFFDNASVLGRVEGTGTVSRQMSDELGLVGPAARACGSHRDVRRDHPSGIYQFAHIPIVLGETGDVYARALIRWLEAERSLKFLLEQIGNLPEGELRTTCGKLAPNHLALSLAEGWRGEIAHIVITDSRGQMARYKVVDPSFHNWMALSMAMRDGAISDFPLCNKSFNLSYAGHDL